jgi:hypothetical protein
MISKSSARRSRGVKFPQTRSTGALEGMAIGAIGATVVTLVGAGV